MQKLSIKASYHFLLHKLKTGFIFQKTFFLPAAMAAFLWIKVVFSPESNYQGFTRSFNPGRSLGLVKILNPRWLKRPKTFDIRYFSFKQCKIKIVKQANFFLNWIGSPVFNSLSFKFLYVIKHTP